MTRSSPPTGTNCNVGDERGSSASIYYIVFAHSKFQEFNLPTSPFGSNLRNNRNKFKTQICNHFNIKAINCYQEKNENLNCKIASIDTEVKNKKREINGETVPKEL